jgi:CubicO group peptidase (beta-lactamase class C family)
MAPLTVEVDPAEVGFDPAALTRLDAHLARYVDDGRLPGWSLAISRHGRLAHLATAGRRHVEAGLPMELDTVVRIYSMTKPIVSVAAMMLFEQGRFELTDPISDYLPAFTDLRVFEGGSIPKPLTVPAREPIRVWHLLTHTSGLTYGFHYQHAVDAMYRAAGYEFSVPPGGTAAVVDGLARLPLLFQPGAEWNYSMSTDVLGRLIEIWTGRPLDEALEQLVLGPLGMTDTAFRVPESARGRFAQLYSPRPGGGLVPNPLGDSFLDPSWLGGGGGLVSTLGDYQRFAQLLRGRGRLGDVRLLGDRTLTYMTRNHLPGGADLATFGRPLYAESPFNGVGFGLGFSVLLDPVATRTLGSAGEFGWGGAASTTFWIDPVEDLTVVFLTQLLPSSTYPIRSQLRQLVYSALDGTRAGDTR